MNESYPRARSCAASDPAGPPPADSSRAGGTQPARLTDEALCSEVRSILDRDIPAVMAVRLLRGLFDVPAPEPQPIARDARAWPVLSQSPPHDPRD